MQHGTQWILRWSAGIQQDLVLGCNGASMQQGFGCSAGDAVEPQRKKRKLQRARPSPAASAREPSLPASLRDDSPAQAAAPRRQRIEEVSLVSLPRQACAVQCLATHQRRCRGA